MLPYSALAFDVYGTLIDTNGVLKKLQSHVSERASAVAATWRAKQLEYSFRRGLMERYVPFPVVTEQALAYALKHHQVALSDEATADILSSYAELPAFDDARQALQALQRTQIECFAFSNGPQKVVSDLLKQAELLDYFQQVVSVEVTNTFKPSPKVYQHFAAQAGYPISKCALVSGNPFDIIGAKTAGMGAIWVRRNPATTFDQWDIEPDLVIDNLGALVDAVTE